MILSLFIANASRNIYVEKHWRNVISRSVCDYFFENESQIKKGHDILPVIQTPHHFLINIYREKVYYIAVCTNEVPPLFVIEFLHRFTDILIDYFQSASEAAIKDNIVRVYEILDEMLDNGFPLATESNILQELVRPPNLLRAITDTVTGNTVGSVGDSLPSGQLSNVYWRRSGVKYNRNEAYFDVIEEVNASIDRSGMVVNWEIIGYIDCLIKLSGMPDLTLTFSNPAIIDDVSLHPCVRYLRWDREKIISFIPPDGRFKLMSYHTTLPNNFSLPINVRSSIVFQENSSKIEISLNCKKLMGKIIDQVKALVRMPSSITNVSGNCSVGRSSYDNHTKTFIWEVGKLEPQKLVTLKGIITISAHEPLPSCSPIVELYFYIHQFAASGLKVNRLDMYGEDSNCNQQTLIESEEFSSAKRYRPFKGVKYVTKAGDYQIQS